jgi:hypothetical protein
MSDLVEEYLDELYSKLRGSPRQARRLLAEAEDHLRQGVDEGLAGGLTLEEAQQHAVSSFGSVRAVVRAHDTRLRRVPGAAVLADLVMSGWKLGSIGLLAVGASGLVVAAMNVLFGRSFVAAAAPGLHLPAASCRYWLSNWPSAHSCTQAFLMESSSDAVSLRVAAGLLGLVLLGGYYLAKRRGWSPGVLPDGFTPTIAVTLYGTAGLGLAWLAAMDGGGLVRVAGVTGPGFYLSGAIVALAMAAGYGLNLQRTLLRHARR